MQKSDRNEPNNTCILRQFDVEKFYQITRGEGEKNVRIRRITTRHIRLHYFFVLLRFVFHVRFFRCFFSYLWFFYFIYKLIRIIFSYTCDEFLFAFSIRRCNIVVTINPPYLRVKIRGILPVSCISILISRRV